MPGLPFTSGTGAHWVGISEATPLGTLDTDAIGRISTTVISGNPKELCLLAATLVDRERLER